MKFLTRTFASGTFLLTILAGLSLDSSASHVTNGCHKGMDYLYRGEDFQTKDKFCYVKVNTFLNEPNRSFSIKDLIINCTKNKYLEHYSNLIHDTRGNQLYFNKEQWAGSFDDKLIHHMRVPNSEEVKTFNLYEKQNDQGQNEIFLEFKSENLIDPKESYKIDLTLSETCLF